MRTFGIEKCAALVAVCAIAAFAVLFAGIAQASIKLPNGEYRETVTDLRVKVLGGHVAVERTWIAEQLNKGKYRWYINPAWADLAFEYDDLDASVKSVRRADSRFERAGNDVFVFERVYFIARKDGGWRWYDRDGNWIRYDDKGRITAYGDRNDVTVRFERDGPGRQISRVLDHRGEPVLTFRYEDERVATITDRTNRVVRYRYTGGNLVEVIDVAGHGSTYAYSGGLMTGKTDAEGRHTTIGYAGNRVVRVADALEHVTTWDYAYDRGKRQHTVVEKSAEGRCVERRYGADGQILRELHGTREVFSLRQDGDYVRYITDERGLVTRLEYDAVFHPVKLTFADGTVASTKYDAVLGVPLEAVDERGTRTSYGYDARGNLATLIEAAGTPVQRVTTFRRDALGQVERRTVEGVDDEHDATTLYDYDDYGNVERETDAEEHAAVMTHDVTGNVLTRTDARGKRWTATYDAHGRRKTSSDPLGNTLRFDYDRTGRLLTRTDAADKATVYGYDDAGRVETAADATGATTTVEYDGDGEVRKITDPNGIAMRYGYDADGRFADATDDAGNVVGVDYGTGSADGGLVRRMRYPTYCEDYRYDQRRRVTRVTRWLPCEGEGRRSESIAVGYDAAGSVVSRTDPMQHTTLWSYDALGRIDAMTDALGSRTGFAHDVFDHILDMTDANGGIWRYRYDRNGRLVAESRPLGGTIRYGYDPAGNVETRTSAGGERRVYGYDDAGRRSGETHYAAGSNVPAQRIAYVYEPRRLLASYTQSGSTASAATYTYDDAGRQTSESVTYGAGSGAFTRTFATGYDANGRTKSFTYPDLARLEFRYTADNLLRGADLPGGGAMEWNDFDWFVARRMAAPGITQRIERDALLRPLRIAVQAIAGGTPEAPTGAVLSEETWRYDGAGNPVERITGDGTYAYGYDALDRLSDVTPPAALRTPDGLPVEHYTYDSVHNRASSAAQPGAFGYNADNELLAYGVGAAEVRQAFDANGHVREVTTGNPQSPASMTQTVYDAAERVSQIVRDGQIVARYQYDPFGRRIRKETAQGVTWYQYAEEGLVAEYAADGSPRTYYGWRPDSAWSTAALWKAERANGAWNTYVYHYDATGMPQRMTDAAGNVVWSGVAEAFGHMRVSSSSSIANPLRLPGQYHDDESGLHYNYLRDYEPQTGRYRQRDPIGLAGGPNVYAYVGGRPLAFMDPLGLAESGTYDVNLLNHSDEGWPKSQRATNDPNTLSVIGHGCDSGTCMYDARGRTVDAEKLAQIILDTTDFRQNPRKIDLHVCWAGKGENPLALRVSDILLVDVDGPTREGQIFGDGTYAPKKPGVQRSLHSPRIVERQQIPLEPMKVTP